MTLCSLCASIALPKMRGPNCDQILPHQPTYLALKKSVDAGCQLCRFIWEALEHGTDARRGRHSNRAAMSRVSEFHPGRQISLAAWGGHGANLDRIHIITTGDIPEVDDENAPADPSMHPDYQVALDGVLDLYAYPGDAAAWHGGVTGRPLPLTSGDSSEDFALAEKWLKDCTVGHSKCPRPYPETQLPTRVIDVGPTDGSTEPCLLISRGKTGLYIALSHCWGGKVPLTTTTDTLDERTRCIPFASLPKTFREAVVVTRKLGVRYLWIDSLCILQDSKTDWEQESAVMGNVYASSFLTIAARGAENSKVGCFISREPEPPPVRLRYESPDLSTQGTMYIRSPAFQIERLRETPLDTRGWVLQERLLSPRILYFGRQQLYWECAEQTLRQDGKGADVATDMLRSGVDFKQSLDFNGPTPFINNPAYPSMYNASERAGFEKTARFLQWYNVVLEYTRRDLTYQSDKLPAISGIAKAFQKKMGCTYLAGLWKEDIIAGIAWYMTQPSDEVTSPSLPSWTWARLKGVVRFWSQGIGLPLRTLDGSCKLMQLEYTLAGGLNLFGDITDAELKVCGRLLTTVYKPPPPTAYEFWPTVFALDNTPIGRALFDLKACSIEQCRPFFCLLVHGGKNYAAALVLEQAEGRPGYYRRIGYVSVSLSGKELFMEKAPQVISII